MAIGLLITLAAVVVQLIFHREGVLRTNDLYSVRASREWYVASMTDVMFRMRHPPEDTACLVAVPATSASEPLGLLG